MISAGDALLFALAAFLIVFVVALTMLLARRSMRGLAAPFGVIAICATGAALLLPVALLQLAAVLMIFIFGALWLWESRRPERRP